MLRPATPLSALLGAAFVLLLISVLSTPIIKSIPLGTFQGTDFGVFGFCTSDGACSSIGIGYNSGSIPDDNSSSFDLPESTRTTLSAILVVHPVAALLTLVMFILAALSHMHSASHSARYLLVLFIFTVIDFLICLLAFLVDILLFVPHMAFGTYLVLAATILVAIGVLVSCAMRRTLVSRKARQKRIAENAEMSGENFYNREAQSKGAVTVPSQPPIPLASGGNSGANDSLPAFASFENQRKDDQVSDERIPLTQRSPVERSPNSPPSELTNLGSSAAGFKGPSRTPSRDRYGNPITGASNEYGPASTSSFERSYSRGQGDMRAYPNQRGGRGGAYYGRGGYDNYGPPMRGRGTYGPPGRGGYPPGGGYPPRGGRAGYGPSSRAAYGAGGMRGGRGPSPYDRRAQPNDMQGGYGPESYDAYGQSPNIDSNPAQTTSTGVAYEPYNPNSSTLPRAESPPPLTESEYATPPQEQPTAVEMDATPVDSPKGYGPYGQLRDSDADVAGMVGLQQNRLLGRHDTYMSEASKYSQDEQYLPARTAWDQGSGRNSPRVPSPLNIQNRPATGNSQRRTDTPPMAPIQTGNYYEDIDPRFEDPAPANHELPPVEPVYEDFHATGGGSRSPAESERSNFTSISQRGVNPHWDPPPPMPNQYGPPTRRAVPQRQDLLLNNPDFQVPGASRRGTPGMTPGSAYPTGPM